MAHSRAGNSEGVAVGRVTAQHVLPGIPRLTIAENQELGFALNPLCNPFFQAQHTFCCSECPGLGFCREVFIIPAPFNPATDCSKCCELPLNGGFRPCRNQCLLIDEVGILGQNRLGNGLDIPINAVPLQVARSIRPSRKKSGHQIL